MSIDKLIETLQSNKLLEDAEQVRAFDAAVGTLAGQPELAVAALPRLFGVFDDNCKNEEVMFGLLHLVEDFALDDFLRGLLDALAQMEARAPRWAKLFHYRILNSPHALPTFGALLAGTGDQMARRAAAAILQEIVAEEKGALHDRAEEVLRTARLNGESRL